MKPTMKLRFLTLTAATLLALTACGSSSSAPAAPSSETPVSEAPAPRPVFDAPTVVDTTLPTLIEDGVFAFAPLSDEERLFNMEYEPAEVSGSRQFFSLEFPSGMDTDWLGDNANDSNYTIYDRAADGTTTVYGSVKLSTAPPDLAKAYGTTDKAAQLEAMKSSYFLAEDVYTGLRKGAIDDFGYELVYAGQAIEETLGWSGFYLEFIDQDAKTRGLRLFLCNDKMNEEYYSVTINANIPSEDIKTANRYRKSMFSLRPFLAQ